jgi:elongation factor Ts
MIIGAKQISELRGKTSAGVMDCKEALIASNGSMDEAIVYLRKKGVTDGKSRLTKAASEGTIGCYVHTGGKIAVMVDVCCETDSVAKSEPFKQFAKDIAMHVAAANPQWINRNDVPQEIIDREKDVISDSLKGKQENIVKKIVSGKLDKFFKENCLMEQLFIKDTNLSVFELMGCLIAQVGEKIEIKKFVRYSVGE